MIDSCFFAPLNVVHSYCNTNFWENQVNFLDQGRESLDNAYENGVYFAIAGSCQNPIDYEEIKNLPYYVGSVGTSIEEERRSTYSMTKYYLELMCQRGEKK